MMVAVMFPCARPSAFNHDIDKIVVPSRDSARVFSWIFLRLLQLALFCGIDIILLGKVFYENLENAL
jgi:hypothetical protein